MMPPHTSWAAAASTRGSAAHSFTIGAAAGVPSRRKPGMSGVTSTSARLPRTPLRVSPRNPVMIEVIRISAATATRIPTIPIRLVRRAKR